MFNKYLQMRNASEDRFSCVMLVLIKENYLQLEYIQGFIHTIWVISIILFQHEKSCKEISYEY